MEKEGVLTVTNESRPNYGLFMFGDESTSDSYKDVQLALFIPPDYTGNISVKTEDEKVNIYNISVESLNVVTSDGDVIFEDTKINGQLNCETDDGNIGGTLEGNKSEYKFKTKSSDNEQNIKAYKNNNKVLEFSTRDGDISISFATPINTAR